jgi:hypothetical protein
LGNRNSNWRKENCIPPSSYWPVNKLHHWYLDVRSHLTSFFESPFQGLKLIYRTKIRKKYNRISWNSISRFLYKCHADLSTYYSPRLPQGGLLHLSSSPLCTSKLKQGLLGWKLWIWRNISNGALVQIILVPSSSLCNCAPVSALRRQKYTVRRPPFIENSLVASTIYLSNLRHTSNHISSHFIF